MTDMPLDSLFKPMNAEGRSDHKEILHTLLRKWGLEQATYLPLSQGKEISAFKISHQEHYFLKLCTDASKRDLITAEKNSLEALKKVGKAAAVPCVRYFRNDHYAALLTQYIHPGQPSFRDALNFGRELAELHRCTAPQFGWEEDNYIGLLPQRNTWYSDPVLFYINCRLEPQFELARKNGYALPDHEVLYLKLPDLIPDEKPALIHGDLWYGNLIWSESGSAYLIDPCVHFGIREMDLAMMQLFKGFPSAVYEAYLEHFPMHPGWKQRLPLWQLYYLLVHLNLFGVQYLPAVTNIMESY